MGYDMTAYAKMASLNKTKAASTPSVYTFYITFSTFNATLKQFYGKTTKTVPISPDFSATMESVDVMLESLVYFHTRINDPHSVIIIEVVGMELSGENGQILGR